MKEGILEEITTCVERGKVSFSSPYPPEWAGKEGCHELVRKALEARISPQEILAQALIPGMKNVGDKFRAGEIFLPEVLISAKAMNAGMEHLKPYFQSGEIGHRGKIIMGTVKGDLHDIGKKIVGMFFEGGGWEVIDLGVDVPSEKYLEAIEAHNPQAVGLSALLTTTMVHMEGITKDIKSQHPGVKVIVGGAPLTQSFAIKIGADAYSPDPQGALEYLNSCCVKTKK